MKRQWKRTLSILLSLTMIFSMTSMDTVLAVEGRRPGASGLCEHHREHTDECGYTEGTPEAPCSHEHGDECYKEVTKCVHKHTEDCYDDAESTASGSNAKEPVNCGNFCDEESGCVTVKLNCCHKHDEDCGYIAAVPGTLCTYECEECAGQDSGGQTPPPADDVLPQIITGFPGFASDGFQPLCTITVTEKSTVEAIGLPDTLAVTIDGSDGEASVPVMWDCADDYEATDYETYDFTAALGGGYKLAEGVTTPVITVLIGSAAPKSVTEPNTAPVTTEDTLKDALESGTSSTITMSGDITLTKDVVMGSSHTLDTEGYTLTIAPPREDDTNRINLGSHTLTVMGGGTVEVRKNDVSGFFSAAGTLNLEDITVELLNTFRAGIQVKTVNVNDGATIDLNGTGNECIYLYDTSYILNVNEGGTIRIQNFWNYGLSCSGTLNINNGGEIIVGPGRGDNRGIGIGNPGSLNLNGGTLTGKDGGAVYLREGAKVSGMSGRLNDRGTDFTAEGQVTVDAENTAASQNGLSQGLFVWNGSNLFSKGAAYSIDVTDGTANAATAAQGETVTLTANAAPDGQQFKEWTISPAVTFADGTSKADVTAKFIMPEQGVTATAVYESIPGSATVTTAPQLINALESTTPATINVTEDITLTGAGSLMIVNMGADHALGIAAGKTLIIGNDTANNAALINLNSHTLTINGGSGGSKGKVLIDNYQSNGIYGYSGTLNLENVEVEVTNSRIYGLGNIQILNIKEGATVTLNGADDSLMRLNNGQTATVERGGTVTIAEHSADGIELYGGTLHIDGGNLHVNSTSGTGIWASVGSTLKLSSGGTLDGNGTIHLKTGGKVEGLSGKFTDRGTVFTASGEVTVGPPSESPAANGLTEGNYTWDASSGTFQKPGTAYAVTVTNGTASPTTAAQGATVTLTADAAQSGKQFKEWEITPDVTFTGGTGKTSAIAKFTMPGQTVTATAAYEDSSLANYYITFDPNGGVLTDSDGWAGQVGVMQTVENSGTLRTHELPNATRSGYTLNGWYTNSTGGEQISKYYVFRGNTTVYAHWTPIGGNGDSSGGNSGGGTSKPTGTITTDQQKGQVNSLTGIITGTGSGYSIWQPETKADGTTSWKLRYADGTTAAGTMVTDAAGKTYEQPAWEMVNGAWYPFGADGYVKSGMVFDPALGGYFYIDINTGMKTGWQMIDGKWYYFNPVSDGKRGILFTDTWVDGWYVDKNGIWNEEEKKAE